MQDPKYLDIQTKRQRGNVTEGQTQGRRCDLMQDQRRMDGQRNRGGQNRGTDMRMERQTDRLRDRMLDRRMVEQTGRKLDRGTNTHHAGPKADG